MQVPRGLGWLVLGWLALSATGAAPATLLFLACALSTASACLSTLAGKHHPNCCVDMQHLLPKAQWGWGPGAQHGMQCRYMAVMEYHTVRTSQSQPESIQIGIGRLKGSSCGCYCLNVFAHPADSTPYWLVPERI